MGWELDDVEKPFVAQLQGLNWKHIEGSLDDPAITGRSSFSEVIQRAALAERLLAINLRDGQPWLDEQRIAEALAAITRVGAGKLMEANHTVTELLLKGITVDGLQGWEGGRGQTIQYIDWANPANNHFRVINQFRVDCPPGYSSGKKFIVPDLVLLVNGIPLVVVECKSPSIPEPLAEAVDQLRRYSNQRKAAFEVEDNEGNETLFASVQLLVASSYDEARVGCIGAGFGHFSQWKTVVGPEGSGSEQSVAEQLGKAKLSEQERLVAGMLTPAHLLDLIRHFMLFMPVGGQTIKTVCRYQQYRAVNRTVIRMKRGQTRLEHGESDQRGGIVWHTQGSGKSLTMVFLVRKMRTDTQLRRFKIIVVTDRKDLQNQLSATATLSGELPEVASNIEGVKALARRQGPGLVFATIQKYRNPEQEEDREASIPTQATAHLKAAEKRAPYLVSKPFEVLNHDESILMGDKKRTHEIFGAFIDKYTIKEAEADGATVPVLYEGRTAQGALKDGASLDELFEDLFREHSQDELELIKKKYATKGHIFDAPALIADKARDILRHYVTNILPNGYKAQVVAYSRIAAIRYFHALQAARDQLLAEAEALPAADKDLDDEALCQRPPKLQARVQAWRYRDRLRSLEFAPIISGSNNDPAEWKTWTDGSKHELLIQRFKKPLNHEQPGKTDPLAFLIVKSMLLTGFDAPIEGVMYLDRPIKEAELLQAIARVNRTGFGKRCGIVVDYYGVANHLREALAAYADEDIEGALSSIKDEVPVLRDRHLRVVDVLRRQGIESLEDAETCIAALESEKVRAEFAVKLKAFLNSLDTVLPRPEGLPFVKDAKRLAYIHARARGRYKDLPQLGKDVGAKVRKLIDDHVISLGIDPKIPPIQLTDADFEKQLSRSVNDRAKASEMEHAIRSHVRKHTDEDPVLYRKLSERLNELLKSLGEQWDQLVEQMKKIINELRSGQMSDGYSPLDLPEHYAPFLRTLLDVVCADANPQPAELLRLKDVTVELVDLLVGELQSHRDIWSPRKRAAQEELAGQLFDYLMRLRPPLVDSDTAGVLSDRLMDQARASHERLMQL